MFVRTLFRFKMEKKVFAVHSIFSLIDWLLKLSPKMKTKPITLILTLLFCLSGNMFAENINDKRTKIKL